MTFFDLYDFLSSNIMLPLGGIGLAIFVGWVLGKNQTIDALSNGGVLANAGVVRVVVFLLRWVSPVVIALVMLKGLKDF